uniref:Uncharacterized protein n=1 Tax=Glossina palpalis gambiensis TaxID=67801 RepID=A0A1B0APV2_9MUSC
MTRLVETVAEEQYANHHHHLKRKRRQYSKRINVTGFSLFHQPTPGPAPNDFYAAALSGGRKEPRKEKTFVYGRFEKVEVKSSHSVHSDILGDRSNQ